MHTFFLKKIILLVFIFLLSSCTFLENKAELIVKENKLFVSIKSFNFSSSINMSIEEISENEKKERNKIIYLSIDQNINLKPSDVIEISQEHLFDNLKSNVLYKYQIKMTKILFDGYFIFINKGKPYFKQDININNIPSEIIILSYDHSFSYF